MRRDSSDRDVPERALALNQEAPAKRRPVYYVTAQYTRQVSQNGLLRLRPVGIAHAKSFGCSATACGLEASSWKKFMDLDFALVRDLACPKCVDVVVSEIRSNEEAHLSQRRGRHRPQA